MKKKKTQKDRKRKNAKEEEKWKIVTIYKHRVENRFPNEKEIIKTKEAGSEAKTVSNIMGAISNNTQVIYIICIYKYKYYKGL